MSITYDDKAARKRAYTSAYMRDLYAGRIAAGLCVRCGRRPNTEGSRNCAECRTSEAARVRKAHAARRVERRCAACGGVLQSRERKNCRFCRESASERTRKHVAKRNAQGRCLNCGDRAVEGHRHCVACKENAKAKHARQHAERVASGLCRGCGENRPEVGRSCFGCWLKNSAARATGSRKDGPALGRMLHLQDYKCALSGVALVPGKNTGLDHKIPLARGGAKAIGNVQWVAEVVNRMKTDMTNDEFIAACKLIAERNP